MAEARQTLSRGIKLDLGRYNPHFLVVLLVAVYAVIYWVLPHYPNQWTSTYVFQPVLWLAVAGAVLLLPERRIGGKLRLRQAIIIMAAGAAILQISINMVGGIGAGLGHSPYSHTPRGMLTNVIYAGSMVAGRELSRAYLVNSFKRWGTVWVIVASALFFTLLGISPSTYEALSGGKETLRFIGSTLVPGLALNLLASMLAFLGGPLACIAYVGILEGFNWLSPLLPATRWELKALLETAGPMVAFLLIQSFHDSQARPRHRSTRRGISVLSLVGWLTVVSIALVFVWFSFGVFSVRPMKIVSGSMSPAVHVGDVVIVSKTAPENINVGDIIVYQLGGAKILHRVVKVTGDETSGYSFTTKGDANSTADPDPVAPDQVGGKVILTIPKAGWLLIFLSGTG